MSKKRILFLNYEFPPLGGGAANATEKIFREFAARDDVIVDLITSSLTDQGEVVTFSPQITIYRIPIGKNGQNLNFQSQKELLVYLWRSLIKARSLTDTYQYDLTHSFFTVPSGIVSLYLLLARNLPYIVSLRGADVPGYSERFPLIYKLFTPLIRVIWQRAAYVVTNSRGLTELAQQTAPEQEFKEIYNGVSVKKFSPLTEGKKRPFTILLAARLTHRKGFIYAIDALEKLLEQHDDIEMIVAGGDGGVMRKLKGHAQALSIHKRITFTGRYAHEEAATIYQQADVFVMPSLNEGMSNNALEALASGLPIIMTPTGGAVELVQEGVNGYLVASRSGAAIAERVEQLYRDRDLLERMSGASRQLAESFSWKVTSDQYIDLYNQVQR